MSAQPVPRGCAEHEGRHHAFASMLRHTLPRPIVFTHGVFDLLHAGHVGSLEEARRLGASLVVGVHSDISARRLGRGGGGPVNADRDRMRVVGALASVTAAMVFDEDMPLALMCALRPDIYVKLGEHESGTRMAGAELVAEWGGVAVVVPPRRNLSTRTLVERLRRSWFSVAEQET